MQPSVGKSLRLSVGRFRTRPALFESMEWKLCLSIEARRWCSRGRRISIELVALGTSWLFIYFPFLLYYKPFLPIRISWYHHRCTGNRYQYLAVSIIFSPLRHRLDDTHSLEEVTRITWHASRRGHGVYTTTHTHIFHLNSIIVCINRNKEMATIRFVATPCLIDNPWTIGKVEVVTELVRVIYRQTDISGLNFYLPIHFNWSSN